VRCAHQYAENRKKGSFVQQLACVCTKVDS
jgi:hypothetical protein